MNGEQEENEKNMEPQMAGRYSLVCLFYSEVQFSITAVSVKTVLATTCKILIKAYLILKYYYKNIRQAHNSLYDRSLVGNWTLELFKLGNQYGAKNGQNLCIVCPAFKTFKYHV